MAAELWTLGFSLPGIAQHMAREAEQAGWDGLLFVDSQNLAADSYVALALAAQVTTRIGLGTGVTNPYTRHAAVTASAIAHIQAESGGRALLGIGRGDSALAHLGLAPSPVGAFERYLHQLQTYLRGETVPFDELAHDGHRPVASLGLANVPAGSRLHWLRSGPKVPVAVAATGPKVIAAAARQADEVIFALGASPERIRWGIDTARRARQEAGLDPDAISFGAFVNVVVHPDVSVARRLASGGVASFARFSVMHGRPSPPVSDGERRVLERVHGAYDMTRHTRSHSPQAEALDTDFVERFGIVGASDNCVGRLGEIAALGLRRLVVIGPAADGERAEALEARRHFVKSVMPALRDPSRGRLPPG